MRREEPPGQGLPPAHQPEGGHRPQVPGPATPLLALLLPISVGIKHSCSFYVHTGHRDNWAEIRTQNCSVRTQNVEHQTH